MKSVLSEIRSVSIAPGVVRATLDILRQFGSHGCEGLVLWIGEVTAQQAYITRIVLPDQAPIKDENGVGYFVSGDTLFQLNKQLSETGLRLVAQVHSHPGDAYHSETDDLYTIVTADGGLSLVVPNFGEAPVDPTSWAIYRLRDGNWRELTSEEAKNLIHVSH